MQRKRIAAITLVLALVLSIAASATPSPRYNTTVSCMPGISISGTTASCYFDIVAIKGTSITAAMKLYRVSGSTDTLLKTWDTQIGNTNMFYSDTYTVTRGYTYKVVLDVAARGPGGTDSISKTVTAYCS